MPRVADRFGSLNRVLGQRQVCYISLFTWLLLARERIECGLLQYLLTATV